MHGGPGYHTGWGWVRAGATLGTYGASKASTRSAPFLEADNAFDKAMTERGFAGQMVSGQECGRERSPVEAHCKHFVGSHLHSRYAHREPLVSKYLCLATLPYPTSVVLNTFFRPNTPEGYDMLLLEGGSILQQFVGWKLFPESLGNHCPCSWSS